MSNKMREARNSLVRIEKYLSTQPAEYCGNMDNHFSAELASIEAALTQPSAQVSDSDAQKLCDWLYRVGYVNRGKEQDYDPRGREAWKACYDAITAAPSAAQVPEGFEISRSPDPEDDDIRVSWKDGDAHMSAWVNPLGDTEDVPERLLWKWANSILSAAPSIAGKKS